jgi:hypothetical protein
VVGPRRQTSRCRRPVTIAELDGQRSRRWRGVASRSASQTSARRRSRRSGPQAPWRLRHAASQVASAGLTLPRRRPASPGQRPAACGVGSVQRAQTASWPTRAARASNAGAPRGPRTALTSRAVAPVAHRLSRPSAHGRRAVAIGPATGGGRLLAEASLAPLGAGPAAPGVLAATTAGPAKPRSAVDTPSTSSPSPRAIGFASGRTVETGATILARAAGPPSSASATSASATQRPNVTDHRASVARPRAEAHDGSSPAAR